MEHLQSTHQHRELHKAIKGIAAGRKSSTPSGIEHSEGKLLLSIDDQLRRWEEYIAELFHDTRPDQILSQNSDTGGPPILLEELDHALDGMKIGKAARVDSIPMELLLIIWEVK